MHADPVRFFALSVTGVVFAAVYMLWAVQRAFTGEPDEENAATPDIGARELVTVLPLLGLSLFLGFFPGPALDRIGPSVERVVTHVRDHSDLKIPAVSDGGGGASSGSPDRGGEAG